MNSFDIYISKTLSLNQIRGLSRAGIYAIPLVSLTPSLIILATRYFGLPYRMHLIILISVVLAFALLVLFSHLKIRRALTKHGHISISFNGLIKGIGDYDQIVSFDDIKDVSVKRFLFAFFQATDDGSKAYLLTVKLKSGKELSMVVSAQSTSYPPLNFADTMKRVLTHNRK